MSLSHSTVPIWFSTIITALGTLGRLEALSLVDRNTSDRLVDLLSGDCFPNLRYLRVDLDKDVDFSKLWQLEVLSFAVNSRGHKMVDLTKLTQLRALEVLAWDVLVELDATCRRLEWLHLYGNVDIIGDVSEVTHLCLSERTRESGIEKLCPNIKQLSLFGNLLAASVTIPASVDRLLICRSTVKEIVLPEDKVLEVLSLYNVGFLNYPQTLQAKHIRLGCSNFGSLDALKTLLGKTVLGSPNSLSVECDNYWPDVSALPEIVLQKEDVRRDIQFFATNIPLENPLPPMPKLRELCLLRFADVEHIREFARVTPIQRLFIAGKDEPPFGDWGALLLQDICKSILVPLGVRVPGNHGLTVQQWNDFSFEPYCLYGSFLWADHVRQSSGEFDVAFDFIVYPKPR